MKYDESMGLVTISKKAIAQLAQKIARSCEGVADLTDRSGKDEMSRLLTGGVKGVYISREKGKISAEIYIICRYGADVAAIQEQITEGLTVELGEIGIKTGSVTVYAAGARNVREVHS